MTAPHRSVGLPRALATWLPLLALVLATLSPLPGGAPLAGLPVSAQGQPHTCGGIFPASADATVAKGQPGAALGAQPQLAVARSDGDELQTLVAFSLKKAIPSGATLYSAELELPILTAAKPLPYTLEVHSLKGGWAENSVTWSTRPALGTRYAGATSSLSGGVLSIDVTTLATQWATGAISETSLVLLPVAAMDVRFSSREGQIAPRLVIRCAESVQAPPVDQSGADQRQRAGIDRLSKASLKPLELQLDGGAVRFASFSIPTPQEVRDAKLRQAQWFLGEYKDALRLADPASELQLIGRSPDGQHLAFRQRHNGIPVFPAELAVHLDGADVVGVNGSYIPEITLDPTPRLTAEQAEALALAAEPGARLAGDTQLRYVNRGLLGYADTTTRLAWQVNLATGAAGKALYIDANTAGILIGLSREMEGIDLDVRNGGNQGPNGSNFFCWHLEGADVLWFDERGVAAGASPDAEGFQAFDNLRAVYNFWRGTLGRDSYDDHGRHINLLIHVGSMWRNAQFATWCSIFEFGDGNSTLDIVGHEFTHAVVHHTVDLVYENQPGALNESFADIFGYLVDSDDWTIGEGSTLGVIRDLSDPPRVGQPDHMLAGTSGDGMGLRVLPPGVGANCDANDCGFVHTNSGIPNKAAYLIIQGDTFNGLTVRGIGRAKAARLFYNMLINRRMTAGAQFIDARNGAIAEAASLAASRSHGFTSNDVCQVRNAYAAVGLGVSDRDCDGAGDDTDSDLDGDFVPNSRDNCPSAANSGQSDIDRDGRGDACDNDIDGDSLANSGDNCALVANADQANWDGDSRGDACDDSDSDGTLDLRDNCRSNANSDQRDRDFDGLGDACDADRDGDGITNSIDNSPDNYNPGQEDGDGDSIGNASDLCPSVASSDNSDPDRDGRANPCDDDDDGDSVRDAVDNCPLVANPDQWDHDNNGRGFVCDENEQQLFSGQARELDTLINLRDIDVFRIPLPVCHSCPDAYLPENFQVLINVGLPAGLAARVVDSGGLTVASLQDAPGAAQTLQFWPQPYGRSPGDFGAAILAQQNNTPQLPGAPAPDQTRYLLEIFPTAGADLTQDHRITVSLDEGIQGRQSTVLLPMILR